MVIWSEQDQIQKYNIDWLKPRKVSSYFRKTIRKKNHKNTLWLFLPAPRLLWIAPWY